MAGSDNTMMFRISPEEHVSASEVLAGVYEALSEKGYNPVDQIVGYLLSGDPVYITNHQNARTLVRRVERDELLEELVRSYLERFADGRR